MKDLARIYIKAGDGGDGKLSFRHEKFAPKGGPDGGDGGAGGDVILRADENLENLVEFNFKKRFVAEDGEAGLTKKMHGKDRKDIVVNVPVGTAIYEITQDYFEKNLRDRETFERLMEERRLLVDLDRHGREIVGAWGGRGGLGNWHFRSSTNQTPQEFEPGTPGEEKYLLLELKVVADVGIVGLPNVGKSSLLKALTRANPKIAGYPFTTLEPNLGVMVGYKLESRNPKSETNLKTDILDQKRSIILVDVPGVVEEAWEGKGIGPWFLRHLERTHLLVHVLAPNIEILSTKSKTNLKSEILNSKHIAEQLVADYQIVRKELVKYGKGLPEKKELVVVNKMELVDEGDRKVVEQIFKKKTGKGLAWVSAAMGEVRELVQQLD